MCMDILLIINTPIFHKKKKNSQFWFHGEFKEISFVSFLLYRFSFDSKTFWCSHYVELRPLQCILPFRPDWGIKYGPLSPVSGVLLVWGSFCCLRPRQTPSWLNVHFDRLTHKTHIRLWCQTREPRRPLTPTSSKHQRDATKGDGQISQIAIYVINIVYTPRYTHANAAGG